MGWRGEGGRLDCCVEYTQNGVAGVILSERDKEVKQEMRYLRLGVLFLCMVALAGVAIGAPPVDPVSDSLQIADAEEAAVWQVILPQGKKEFNGIIGGIQAQNPELARSWNSGGQADYTNKAQNVVDFTNYAAVAQWIDYKVSDTRKDWRVLKPGPWVSKAFDISVMSNDDVDIYFENFTDLMAEPNPYDGGAVVPVRAWYSLTEKSDNPPSDSGMWRAAANFLEIAQPVFDDFHDGSYWPLHWDYKEWSVWSLIDVHNCNKPINYKGTGTITIQVTTLRDWVDAGSGDFAANQLGYRFPPRDLGQ